MLKIIIPFLSFCLCFAACKKDFSKQILTLETSLSQQYSAEKAKQLLLLYDMGFSAKPTDSLLLGAIAVKAANLCIDSLKDYKTAIGFIQKGFEKAKPSAEEQVSLTALLLRMHNDVLHRITPGFELDSVAKAYISTTLSAHLPAVEQNLKDTKSQMVDSTMQLSSPNMVKRFAAISESLSTLVSQSDPERACNLLFEAANASRAAGNFQDAVKLYDLSAARCKDKDKAGTAMFLVAFTCENDMNDLEEARSFYNKYLLYFPNHDLVQSARISIKNLGVPEDKLLDILTKSNK